MTHESIQHLTDAESTFNLIEECASELPQMSRDDAALFMKLLYLKGQQHGTEQCGKRVNRIIDREFVTR